jgi:CRISPR-associated endonuclease/helicase Cas3
MTLFPSFAAFFQALWKRAPYPWQERLADGAAAGDWPKWVTLPTGTGKTACLDIAVFALAAQVAKSTQRRTAPVRIVFAVNRRIVVDEAFERARSIAVALRDAAHGTPLHAVASALRTLAGEDSEVPLEAFPLRGATYTDSAWARSPFQPLILSTTLDQLGSRLLFRGYGVSDYAQPLHAALLANDALLILDEAHTSKAFSQTLRAIDRFRGDNLKTPFASVQLTATPPPDASEPFGLSPSDLDPVRCPELFRRLRAAKPASLVAIAQASGTRRHDRLATAAVAQAQDYLQSGYNRILIVVNRVASVEAVTKALQQLKMPKRASVSPLPAVHSLTGRLRPLDRKAIIEDIVARHHLKSSTPPAEVPPLVLVATQCIEVGADYDFDALITELAPLDALRQRFGRLNRSGRMDSAPATILAPSEALDDAKPDPLYGIALPHVWKWLNAIGSPVDFGIDALSLHLPSGQAPAQCLAPSPDAPILLPTHLDLLCQTSPRPHIEPDVALYIHGMTSPQATVSILCRADLWQKDEQGWKLRYNFTDLLAAAPPLSTEMSEVPLYVAQQWLSFSTTDETGDAPAAGDTHENKAPARTLRIDPLPVRLSRGKYAALSEDTRLHPGDILILFPTVDATGLLSLSQSGLTDQFEAAHLLARDKICLRITPDTLQQLPAQAPEKCRELLRSLVTRCLLNDDNAQPAQNRAVNTIGQWIDATALRETIPEIAKLFDKIGPENPWHWAAAVSSEKNLWRIAPYGDEGILARHPKRVGYTPWPLEPERPAPEEMVFDRVVPLSEHNQAVSRRSGTFATALPDTIRGALQAAGIWHDLGKADPRFQALLHTLPVYAVLGGELIAKSCRPLPASERQRAADEAGLPRGFRHELLSAAVLLQASALTDHPERDLVLHLVASHHGRCRPFAPAIADSAPEPFAVSIGDERLDFPGTPHPMAHLLNGVAERFWQLCRRFGWWGLPYLELLLRLADQIESAALQEQRDAVVRPEHLHLADQMESATLDTHRLIIPAPNFIMELPYLREDNPRDFLTALGLLRLVSLQWPQLRARLGWDAPRGTPRLYTTQTLPDDWSAVLTSSLHSLAADPARPLFHGSIIKTDSNAFRQATENALKFAMESEHALRALSPLLYAAYSAQTLDDGGLHVTAFSFGNGNSGKNLLLDVSQLIAAMKPGDLDAALAGTLKPISAKSLRWHPAEFRAGAYRSHDPGKGIKGDDTLDQPAFNVLAFFGLTFYPCAPRVRGDFTLGMHRREGGTGFEWPIWCASLGPDAVSSILHQTSDTAPTRGIERFWRSRRFVSDKSIYFSPATRIG